MNEDKPAEQGIQSQPAVMRATIEIIRAGTGKKETYELVGTPEQANQPDVPSKAIGDISSL